MQNARLANATTAQSSNRNSQTKNWKIEKLKTWELRTARLVLSDPHTKMRKSAMPATRQLLRNSRLARTKRPLGMLAKTSNAYNWIGTQLTRHPKGKRALNRETQYELSTEKLKASSQPRNSKRALKRETQSELSNENLKTPVKMGLTDILCARTSRKATHPKRHKTLIYKHM